LNEEWRTDERFDGNYAVSNFGQVRRETPGTRTYPGKILIPNENGRGYLKCTLYYLGLKKTWRIHNLVAHNFIGPCPKGMEVHHIDDDRKNNRSDNLEYVTHSKNVWHTVRRKHGEGNTRSTDNNSPDSDTASS
jgi:hypothetical protein